jgi:hypothetical protein
MVQKPLPFLIIISSYFNIRIDGVLASSVSESLVTVIFAPSLWAQFLEPLAICFFYLKGM